MTGKLWTVALMVALTAGCAASAKDELAKLEVGMSKSQVSSTLGQPEAVETVRFAGHDRDYEVWQYQMVPNTPLCPSEALPRFMTGVATAGLSEIAWTRAKAEAHWVYFLDGSMVYSSPAFDCSHNDLCKVNRKDKAPSARN